MVGALVLLALALIGWAVRSLLSGPTTAPKRAQQIRVLVSELARIGDRLAEAP